MRLPILGILAFIALPSATPCFAGTPIEDLLDFIRTHSVVNPSAGETVNLTFFKVGLNGNPDRAKFRQLVQTLGLAPKGVKERGYIELAGNIGDRGYTLRLMGLGHLLGEWQVLSPDIVTADLSITLKLLLARRGYVTIISSPSAACGENFEEPKKGS